MNLGLWKFLDGLGHKVPSCSFRRTLIVSMHILLIVFSDYLAFLIRFEGSLPPEAKTVFLQTLPIVMLIQFGCISYFGLNKGLWRYAGIGDLFNIMKSVSLSSLILVMIIHFLLGIHSYPRSVYIIDWLILTMLLGGVRMQRRLVRELVMLNTGAGKRVLLIGAGDAGEMILREIKQNLNLPYQPIGFIDDDPLKQGLKIHGVPVLGTLEDLNTVVSTCVIEEIIITIASAGAGEMREIVADCRKTGLALKIIPGIGKILNGHVSVSEIREVRIEDLLCREVVKTDATHIEADLKGKKVLITGAAGSIGSELCHQIARYSPQDIILLDQSESGLYFTEMELKSEYPGVSFVSVMGDIRDGNRMRETFSLLRPDIVFHSAAYKHVPLLEDNPSEAVKNNIIATRNLALIAQEASLDKFVLISTDKAVNPVSVMGMTKRVAEMYIQELAKPNKTQFVIVRFGNVLGSNGSVIPLFKMQIERKMPVTVTHPEVMRYFMTISEAVQLVLQASVMGTGGEIFVLDMGEQIKILDLARHMIHLSGYEPDVDVPIVFTGLRPGEKLSEELFDDAEKVEPTKHGKIRKATSRNKIDLGGLSDRIRELEQICADGDEVVLIKKLCELASGMGRPSPGKKGRQHRSSEAQRPFHYDKPGNPPSVWPA